MMKKMFACLMSVCLFFSFAQPLYIYAQDQPDFEENYLIQMINRMKHMETLEATFEGKVDVVAQNQPLSASLDGQIALDLNENSKIAFLVNLQHNFVSSPSSDSEATLYHHFYMQDGQYIMEQFDSSYQDEPFLASGQVYNEYGINMSTFKLYQQIGLGMTEAIVRELIIPSDIFDQIAKHAQISETSEGLVCKIKGFDSSDQWLKFFINGIGFVQNLESMIPYFIVNFDSMGNIQQFTQLTQLLAEELDLQIEINIDNDKIIKSINFTIIPSNKFIQTVTQTNEVRDLKVDFTFNLDSMNEKINIDLPDTFN